jgi:hypothetical protein
VVVVPRSHVLAQRRNIAFVEVLDEEFVGLAAGNVLAEYLAWQSAVSADPSNCEFDFADRMLFVAW